jgi:hypothetical protein
MKSFMYFMMVMVVSFYVGSLARATEMKDVPDMTEQAQKAQLLNMVSGVVQDVQGDWCVIQDSQGTEWRIKVDNYTDTIGNVLTGSTIIAMVEPDGHAKEVKVVPN